MTARNSRFFEEESQKLDSWADDQLASAEKALKDMKKRIRDLRNEASQLPNAEAIGLEGNVRQSSRRSLQSL